MNRNIGTLSTLVGAGILFTSIAGARVGWNDGDETEFDEFEIFIEINATDGDAGLQGVLDGGPWTRAEVFAPSGTTIFELEPGGSLASHGMSEVQWESNEPAFDDGYTIDDFLLLFEEGEYEAEGMGINGVIIVSEAELTFDLPAGPVVTSHTDESGNMRIVWERVTDDFRGGPLGSDIVGYVVVVEFEIDFMGEEITQVLEIDTCPTRSRP